jgi:heavy metal sensor kinase
MIPKSIRWRLQIWYGLVFLAVLSGFGVTAYELERNRQFRNMDAEFQKRLAALSDSMRPTFPRGGFGPGNDRGGGPGDQFPGGGPPDDRNGPPDGGGGTNPDQYPNGGPPNDRNGPPDGGGGMSQDQFPNGGPPGGRPFPGPGGPDFPFRPPSNLGDLFGAGSNSFYYVIWDREGNELARSDAAPRDVPPPDLAGEPGGPPPAPRTRGVLREFSRSAPGGRLLLVGRSIAEDLAGLRVVACSLAAAGAVVLLLGLTGGWWIATRAMRPVEVISATAVKFAGGDLSQRISAADTETELGRLAGVLNSTFSRLEAAFDQQRQFTANAAHELRTPIAVILTQTQTALTRERAAPEYRATVEACQRAAQRMRKLTESLLELARLDASQEAMKQLPFDLSKLAGDCVELVAPLADARRVKIHCAVSESRCVGDPERMSQVLVNLLANAIEYNKESGEVRITSAKQGGAVVLTIADTGEGIAPEDLPRVFERFYRADKSRSGSGGHTGLGLAISRAIVQAHGGSIEAASQPGAGSTFTLTLPLAAPSSSAS